MLPATFVRSLCFGVAVLALSACASSRVVMLNDNSKGYHIFCNGFPVFGDITDCYDHAANMCGADGYTVLRQNQVPYSHAETVWSLSTDDILVRCNNPAAMQSVPVIQ